MAWETSKGATSEASPTPCRAHGHLEMDPRDQGVPSTLPIPLQLTLSSSSNYHLDPKSSPQ